MRWVIQYFTIALKRIEVHYCQYQMVTFWKTADDTKS